MVKSSIAAYLQHESKTLGSLLNKFNRLKIWNNHLRECLSEELTLLEHCQIVGLDKTSLIVIADNPHWVTRFRFFIPDLLIKLRRYDEFKGLLAICCKVRPLNYPSTKPKRKPLIISNNTAEILKEAAKKIKNEKLKAILFKMAERNIEKL